jgi:hypothetical protein
VGFTWQAAKGYEIKKPLSLYTVNVYATGSVHGCEPFMLSVIRKTGPLPIPSPAGEGHYSNVGELPEVSIVPVKNKQRQISKGMRFDVLKRDNYKCRICGARPQPTTDLFCMLTMLNLIQKRQNSYR